MVELETFTIPSVVGPEHRELGCQMIEAWKRDGIFQISLSDSEDGVVRKSFAVSKDFFSQPIAEKEKLVSDLTYSGYVKSGEENTGGLIDLSEIFTVCKDLPLDDEYVKSGWPCHGPVLWPNDTYKKSIQTLMEQNASFGDRMLHLVGLGLDLKDPKSLCSITKDGWHHMRNLRFPPKKSPKSLARGIGSHTDYGMVVIAAQDDVGGLWIRPPIEGEYRPRNWLASESAAGLYEDDDKWFFAAPVPKVMTVFPGDVLQFLTGNELLSTPHQVALNFRERFALAYFHEPNFHLKVTPLNPTNNGDFIHYGTHFTNMFMRCYPERITTKRILNEGRLDQLQSTKWRYH